MFKLTLLALACLVAFSSAAPVLFDEYSPEALSDEIKKLPGIPDGVGFRMFSGYIPLKNSTRQMFYWFVESESNPALDPLVFWTNGGPGCSGLGGFMTEQGPFRPTADGKLVANDHSWNKIANMIFIEQPAGVGFSTTSEKIAYGDAQAAEDNREFMLGWLQRFPQYNESSFYITSESYGGHYMPTLAKELVTKGGTNFKGFMVGNPLTHMPYRDYGQFGTWYGHQLLPKPMWDTYTANNCEFNETSTVCTALLNDMSDITGNMDPYALDFPTCSNAGLAAGREERHAFTNMLAKAHPHGFKTLGAYFPASYEPCSENYAATYLNRDDVKKAIHAKLSVTWSLCADIDYSMTDVTTPMMPVYKYLLDNHPELKITIYSGDDDSICATLGTQQFIWDLGYKVVRNWEPWTLGGQISGFTTVFENRFTLRTVHGAGHMVPATRPAQALAVLQRYLEE